MNTPDKPDVPANPPAPAASSGATGSAFRFTPAVKWTLARAAKLAAGEGDLWVRTDHIQRALHEGNKLMAPRDSRALTHFDSLNTKLRSAE